MKVFVNSLIIIVFLLLFIELVPMGYKKYKVNNINVEAPIFSIKNNNKFYTIKRYSVLVSELDKMKDNYEIVSCNNKKYYYNRKENYTIKKININKNFFINSFSIDIENGKVKCNTI